ncbi:MAG: hypothetical protein H8E57_02110, partial [Candidatus Cloacimonetes bacterium]|nr:hypothetical protein [Candidatus Cloacimonadota bacterium]
MKKNKMFISLLIMILSIIILVVISVFSYSARSGSQELPAEIKSEKTIVSSLSEGILTNIFVKLYQPVDQDQLLMELENPQLTAKLENLFKEKNILENLINSETGGVLLTLRLNELDSKIKKKENELEKLNLEQIILLKDLEFYSEQSELSEKEYVIMQELSVNKQISDEEFNKASEQHYETRN